MTPNELIEQLRTRFGPAIQKAEKVQSNLVMATVDRKDSVEVNRYIFHDLQARFVVAVGTDFRDVTGQFLVDYVYSLADSHQFLAIRLPLPADDLWINAITGAADIPAANWLSVRSRICWDCAATIRSQKAHAGGRLAAGGTLIAVTCCCRPIRLCSERTGESCRKAPPWCPSVPFSPC